MARRFPKKTFVPLGTLPVERLGLSSRRSGELRLRRAWEHAAGSHLAATATPLGIRRRVLDVRMTTADDAWCRTLFELLPGLGATIAAAHPSLEIESVRLLSVEGQPVGETQPVAGHAPVGSGARSAIARARPVACEEPRPLSLERVMRAYLSRAGTSSSSD